LRFGKILALNFWKSEAGGAAKSLSGEGKKGRDTSPL